MNELFRQKPQVREISLTAFKRSNSGPMSEQPGVGFIPTMTSGLGRIELEMM
jgi:hypothetical protein